jgi:hypothetical protein
MDKKHESIVARNLFYCFVRMDSIGDSLQYKFFVVPSKKVARYVTEEHAWWLEHRNGKDGPIRVFRLGTQGEFEYPVCTSIASKHENKWSILC